MIRNILFLTMLQAITFVSNAQVVINEGSNRNYTQTYDEAGANNDWIEIYNQSNSAINLNQWRLTDNIKDTSKWIFPDTSIEAGALFLIQLSGKGMSATENVTRIQKPSPLHTNFKLSSKGETVYLFNEHKVFVDSLSVRNLQLNHSIGRLVDGSAQLAIFTNATPGTSNNTTVANTMGYANEPIFSQKPGFYDDAIEVSLSTAEASSEIRYTTNGSEPTANSSIYGSTTIKILNTRTVKAKCFSTSGKLPGKTVAATYFINAKHTIPVLSITTNNENLFGSKGICDNWTQDWERPCYIEYFDKNRDRQFAQNAGIQIDGGAGGSRSNPQHSFRVEPGNSALGDGDVKYKLIPDRFNRDSYESFYLRNGSNQYLVLPYKDAVEVKAMGKGTNNYYAAYTPISVYINGNYWGVYELREKLNKDYFVTNYGANPDSIDLLSMSYWYNLQLRAVEGSVEPFLADYDKFLKLNQSDPQYLQKVDSFLDVIYYTDYIIAESWICNTDWPNNNIKIVRSGFTKNRWRFAIIDMEWALAPNNWTASSTDHIAYMLNQDPQIPYIRFWKELIKNETYRNYFINRFADVMNTTYQFSNLASIEQDFYMQSLAEMQGHFQKWVPSSVDYYMKKHTANHNTFVKSLKARTDYVRTHIKKNFGLPKQVTVTLDVAPEGSGKIKISTVLPDSFPWKGEYFDGVPVTISAIANPGFTFEKWDASSLINNLKSNKQTLALTTSEPTFKAHFVKDTLPFAAVVINEINYKDEPSRKTSDWIELYNYGNTSISLAHWKCTDDNPLHVFTFPDTAAIAAGGTMIVARDIEKFRTFNPTVTNICGPLGYGLESRENNIHLFNDHDSLIATVHYIDSISNLNGANGIGWTMELSDPYKNASVPGNWYNGNIGGSPGKTNIPSSETLLVSEICNHTVYYSDMGDYIELQNNASEPIDISGWQLKDKKDSNTFTIPSPTIIEPGQQFVIAQSTSKLKNVYPNITAFTGGFDFGFSGEGDWIRIFDTNNNLRISVKYNDKQPWPEYIPTAYATLEYKYTNGNQNNGNNWFFGCINGSPAEAYNASKCIVDIAQNTFTNGITASPNPATDYTIVNATIPNASKYCKLSVINSQGIVICKKDIKSTNNGTVTQKLDLNPFEEGLLLIIVQTESLTQMIKVMHLK